MSRKNTEAGTLSWLIILLLVGLVGYFVYDQSIVAGAAMVLLYFLLSISIILSCIPFGGIFVQWYVVTYYVMPWVYSVSGTYPTLMTEIMMLIFLIIGLVLWIVVTAAVILALSGRPKPKLFKV